MLGLLLHLAIFALGNPLGRDELEKAAIADSKQFLQRVTGPTEATGIKVSFLSEPKVRVLDILPEGTEYLVTYKVRLVPENRKADSILKATQIDGIQEASSLIYFVDGKPVHDSLYVGFELMHIESQQWEDFKATMPDDAKRSEDFVRWIVEARKAYATKIAGKYQLLPLDHLRFEGVKFYAIGTLRDRTVQLQRVTLNDGNYVYSLDPDEVESLRTSSAKLEPLPAFVLQDNQPGTRKLYRFEVQIPNGHVDCFMTAFEPEMRDVSENEKAKLRKMDGFVYPHDHSPNPDDGLVPIYSFYNEDSGKHFYTESEELKFLFTQALESR